MKFYELKKLSKANNTAIADMDNEANFGANTSH